MVAGEFMKYLQQRILQDGKVFPGEVLKVSSFLNHQLDDCLLDQVGKHISDLFANEKITKILTIEASGIAIACYTARYIHTQVLFAKKEKTSNVSDTVYSAQVVSYTHKKTSTIVVDKEFLTKDDRVLVVDDFLARGEALRGLISLIDQAGATLVGCAIAIEKGFQGGGDQLRAQGVRVESLAIIDSMTDDSITFRE